ncbi:MAG: aminodeoxychorismate/anthranilate synthase component II [Armatimonadetes bacterium]|nr:aminodeoxychorismate/anthranilate synthase component II [Armatimonadota bacterium]
MVVIDNYDSFTYNLVQYLGQCGAECTVRRNDETDLEGVAALSPDGILLSPGPCRPTDSGVCLDIAKSALSPGTAVYGLPLFGVCLGHQAIGTVGGGTVDRARTIRHGKTSLVEHDGRGLFSGLPNPMTAVRYHSLSILNGAVPTGFIVTARSLDDDEIMGVRHETLPIEGVQFHPESVMTENGIQIVRNFVDAVVSARSSDGHGS